MRHYETIFIINPDISEEDTEAVIERYAGILAEGDSFMAKVDKWGRRRLAYPIKGRGKGFYVLFDYGALPEPVAEMERNFKIDDNVMRFLTVKQDDFFDLEAAQAAQAAAQEAQQQKASEAAETEAAAEAEADQEAQTESTE